MIDQRRTDEEAIPAPRDRLLGAIHYNGGPGLAGAANKVSNSVLGSAVDKRPHFHAFIRASADLHRPRPLGDLRHQFVSDRPDDDRRRDGHATLARGAESRR